MGYRSLRHALDLNVLKVTEVSNLTVCTFILPDDIKSCKH